HIRANGFSPAQAGNAGTPNLIHVIEDPTLQWGVDALCFFLSEAQYEEIVNRDLLATIPPVTTLCLFYVHPKFLGRIHFCRVLLASPNFTHLLVTVLGGRHDLSIKMDTQEA
ncbi:hypothetical protein GOP47_0009846, partial [Adiantum capillus-veneris]